MGIEQIGGIVRNTLADAYRMRGQQEGPWTEPRHQPELDVFAAALLARDLMRGDPDSFKAGYSRANAVIAAREMFPRAPGEAVEEALDDLQPIWRFCVEERAWSEDEARQKLAAAVTHDGWAFELSLNPESR